MMGRIIVCLSLSILIAACQSAMPLASPTPIDPGDTPMTFKLSSPAFSMDDLIPKDFTCDGANRSPQLNWIGAPATAKSFVLIVDDPDAPNGTFTHWVLFDIPATLKQLNEGASTIGVNGTNSFGQSKYQGPCPPIGHGPHHYYFTLYALDVATLNLKAGTPRRQVEAAIESHNVGRTHLIGQYERK
jgi:hypothetical protein